MRTGSILIIGASGFIGRHLYEEAALRRLRVWGTCRSRRRDDLLPFDLAQDRITDKVPREFRESARSGEACTVLCASHSKIDYCRLHQEDAYNINVTHTLRMIDELAALGSRIVFLSSDNVFSGVEGYYDEDDPVSPVNEYGRQKALVEARLLSAHPTALVLRLNRAVSGDTRQEHLFSQWLRAAREFNRIRCLKGHISSVTDVRDTAAAAVTAIERGLSGLYHCANNEYFPAEELARQFLRAAGLGTVQISALDSSAFNFADARPLCTYLDTFKFRNTCNFDFRPVKSILKEFAQRLKG